MCALLLESRQVGHQVMNVVVGVLRQQVDVGFGGVVHLDLDSRGGPGAVMAGGIAEGHREFVQVSAAAGDGLAGRQGHGHLRFGAAGIHEALEEFQPVVAGGDAREVAGGGVAGIAFARSVEILLALVDVAGGQVRRVDTFAAAFLRLAMVFRVCMKAASAASSPLVTVKRGILLRPLRTTGPIWLPSTSSATSLERVRSGPSSPPPVSRPWQKAHCWTKEDSPALTSSGGKVWAVFAGAWAKASEPVMSSTMEPRVMQPGSTCYVSASAGRTESAAHRR